tara:strand:- start:354 stop:524 length:171 start_codon:yes stop_codon:yes gene_type:complete
MIRLQEKIDFKTMLALALTESEQNKLEKNNIKLEKNQKRKKFNQLFNNIYIRVTNY